MPAWSRRASAAPLRPDAADPYTVRPRIEVDVAKTLHSRERRFELCVSFRTHAARTVIFGPSGAGKTATLRAVAGLLTPDAGRIRIDGRVLFDRSRGIALPSRERQLGYLFQDYALFPHLNVRQNVGFGLSAGLANPGRRARIAEVDRWLRAFGLERMAGDLPSQLSGGQRQRTALARALVGEPEALLLDEPFAALDPPLRERLRVELDALLAEIGVPVLMITHDPADLERFGERVLHMEEGRVVDDMPGAPS